MKVLLSWSSGKDAAWALHALQKQPDVEVVGLLTTFNSRADRVAMHAVRRQLAEAQATTVGLPLMAVDLPWPCPNGVYEARFAAKLAPLIDKLQLTHMAFGDLFLQDVRDYRVAQLASLPIEPLFPLWKRDTAALASEMIDGGQQALLTCVDPQQLDPRFVGRRFDHALLDELPEGVDPCGENGEFHSFVYASPAFAKPLDVSVGQIVNRDGFWFADVESATTQPSKQS